MRSALKTDKISSQNLSAGPLSYTTSYGRKFKLEQVMVHASQPITETITITQVSKHGSNYDVVLRKHDMASETDFLHRPEGECNFQNGDEIKVECTNANLVGIVYPLIKTSEFLF